MESLLLLVLVSHPEFLSPDLNGKSLGHNPATVRAIGKGSAAEAGNLTIQKHCAPGRAGCFSEFMGKLNRCERGSYHTGEGQSRRSYYL